MSGGSSARSNGRDGVSGFRSPSEVNLYVTPRAHAGTPQSFTLHIGASLQVPTKDAFSKPAYEDPVVASAAAPATSEHQLRDPFEVRGG